MFDQIEVPRANIWNSILKVSLTTLEKPEEALYMYGEMHQKGSSLVFLLCSKQSPLVADPTYRGFIHNCTLITGFELYVYAFFFFVINTFLVQITKQD